jgi:hypothetical protein
MSTYKTSATTFTSTAAPITSLAAPNLSGSAAPVSYTSAAPVSYGTTFGSAGLASYGTTTPFSNSASFTSAGIAGIGSYGANTTTQTVYENVEVPVTEMEMETVMSTEKFKVTVVKLETKDGDKGADWFVKLKYAGRQQETSVKQNAGHGTTHWNETFSFDLVPGNDLVFEIEDKDRHENDHLGKCDLGHKPEKYPHGSTHHHDKAIHKSGHKDHRGKLTVMLEPIKVAHTKSVPVTKMVTQQVVKQIEVQTLPPVTQQVAKQIEVQTLPPRREFYEMVSETVQVPQEQTVFTTQDVVKKESFLAQFNVTVVKLETKDGDKGADWFVKLKYAGSQQKTSVKQNAGHGTTHWNETFTFDLVPGSDLVFEIEDKDRHENDHLGKCDLGHKPENYPHGSTHHHDKAIHKKGHKDHRGKLIVMLELINAEAEYIETIEIPTTVNQMVTQQVSKMVKKETMSSSIGTSPSTMVSSPIISPINVPAPYASAAPVSFSSAKSYTSAAPVAYSSAKSYRSASPTTSTTAAPVSYSSAKSYRSASPTTSTTAAPVSYSSAKSYRSASPTPFTTAAPVSYSSAKPYTSAAPVSYSSAKPYTSA